MPAMQDDQLERTGIHQVRRSSTTGLLIRFAGSGRVACAVRVRATGECLLGSRRYPPIGLGPCRPAASVTRRETAGQTRSTGTVMQPADRPAAAPGVSPYTAASCDPTTHARVSLRDRRDTRPHAHHLLRHPDLRRPAVQGPAAVDGAHAGARAVRPGGQADAALRHLQARRHRRLHAARRLGPGRRHAVHQAGHRLGGDTVEIRDGDVYINGTAARRAVPLRGRAPATAAADDRAGRRASLGRSRRASCS